MFDVLLYDLYGDACLSPYLFRVGSGWVAETECAKVFPRFFRGKVIFAEFVAPTRFFFDRQILLGRGK